jgi:fibronectin-binding autotransporter adhesin
MSELRVDNIVSQDGTAAPVYSKGLNIGAGVTLTNNGDYVVGGATSIAGAITASNTGTVALSGGVTVAGVTTVSNTLNVTGSANVTGALNVTGGGNFNTTGIITAGTLSVSGSTSFGEISGTITNLVVGAGASIVGVTTAASFEQADGSKIATTGKAIAMSMVFGG